MSELGERIQLIFDTARLYEQKIKELEQQKAELIAKLEFIKDFGYKNSGCGFSCAKVADEILKKYSGE